MEFTHRMFSSVTGFLILGNAIYLWRKFRDDRQIRWMAVGSVLLLGAVGVMGGINVLKKLPSGFTAIDMAFAALLLAELTWLTVVVKNRALRAAEGAPASVRSGGLTQANQALNKPASFAMTAVYLQIVLGGFLKHSSAAYTYVHPTAPLPNELITNFLAAEVMMILHMLVSFLVVLSLLWLFVSARRQQIYRKAAASLLVLAAVQAFLGFMSLVTKLELLTTTAHMAVASVMLMVSVYITANVKFQVAKRFTQTDRGRKKNGTAIIVHS